ncbi:MAG TPA: selenide, water dikinase SelD [Terracidiphilus sp.]|nr:selenide, water dikinase SelD [Terracidiphilus sp.]
MTSTPTVSDTTTPPQPDATAPVRLTQRVKAGGCASKLAPGILNSVLSRLPAQHDDNLLVGFATSDDAGVYRINDHQALVQTVDFFTPMVDDPFTFGRIAATNALSDVYAMGGSALTALSIVCFPQNEDPHLLEQILRGGLSVMQEAECIVVGGHSVRDPEIKFGYAVTGLIDPNRVLKNCTAQPGDALVLAKSIGTGVVTTALKQGRAEYAWVDAAIRSMTQSNRIASEIATRAEFDAHSMTDVTGFGLMGHSREVALGSGVRLIIDVASVPLLEGASAAAQAGCIPAGLLANREFAECLVEDDPHARIEETLRALLYDPQTSGGLLIALPPANADRLVAELRQAGYPAAKIGQVGEGPAKIILR